MAEEVLSGMCIGRSLRFGMSAYDVLRIYYQNFLVPHRWYTRDERIEIMHEVLDEVTLDDDYTLKSLEIALQKELRIRDRSPLPRNYDTVPIPLRKYGSFIVTSEIVSPLVGTLTEDHILRFLDVFIIPSRIEKMRQKKVLVPTRTCDYGAFRKVFPYLKPGMEGESLLDAFERFLLVPDIRGYLGENAPIGTYTISEIHNHYYSSKLSRIRDEVLYAKSRTYPCVAKFFDVVLERVIDDHYELETAHFEKRMALVDRLQQLPAGTKSRGQVRHEFIEFNARKRIELKLDVIRSVYPFLADRLGSAIGRSFQESFVEHLRTTYPDKSNPKPVKAAMIFAERFFSWASVTLEFEKELVEPVKSNYAFFLPPHDKSIPLRVLHLPSPTPGTIPFGFVFLDEVLHALRLYQKAYGDLEIDIPSPNHPGPVKMFCEFARAHTMELDLRKLTKGRIVFDMVPLPHVPFYGGTYFPIPGPFNRLVINATTVLTDIIEILVDELHLGFKLDPAHPEVAAFGEKLANFFPITVHGWLIDMKGAVDLKWEAHALKKFQVEKAPTSDRFKYIQCYMLEMSLEATIEDATNFLHRVFMTQAFPKLGRALHMKDCIGDMCSMCFLPDFKPFFGPITKELAELGRKLYPHLMCNAPGDRNVHIEKFEDHFKAY